MSAPKDSSSDSTTGKGASSSRNSQPGATKGGAGLVSTPANSNIGGRRRSSGGGAFAGLQNQKRSSEDPLEATKKASWMEQKPGGGRNPITNMWNNFTKGPIGAG